MRHRIQRSIKLVGLAAIAGCSDLFGLRGPEINVSLDVQPAVGAAFVMRTDIGGQRVELTTDAARGRHASTDVRGDLYGNVPVRVALLTGSGNSITDVSFLQDFHRGYQHWVAAVVGPQRPLGICIGVILAAPLAVGSTDTLFVMPGNLPRGSIC